MYVYIAVYHPINFEHPVSMSNRVYTLKADLYIGCALRVSAEIYIVSVPYDVLPLDMYLYMYIKYSTAPKTNVRFC